MRPGLCLAATEWMSDPKQEQAVVILFHADESSHLGIAINRRADQQYFERISLFHGGDRAMPDGRAPLSALFADPGRTKDAFHPVKGVAMYFGNEYVRPIIDPVEQGTADRVDPARLWVFQGFMSWAPGILKRQIEDGLWDVFQPDAEFLLSAPAEVKWAKAREKLGKDPWPATTQWGKA